MQTVYNCILREPNSEICALGAHQLFNIFRAPDMPIITDIGYVNSEQAPTSESDPSFVIVSSRRSEVIG